ncbi:MAG TPA: cob(I)yrinic acid a,c-diamide adenosyltransferase [Patescibacteria group bacterium]|nr:cob(I)yrinic acid a,c-diamide adenosyltransferase [Patescibacteria group bacterium]
MVRLTRIYTKTGDKGTTALGSGRRVSKDHPRIEACGDVDELNAALGLAIASGLGAETADLLRAIQNDLFDLGADLTVPAAPAPRGRPGRRAPLRITPRHVAPLEAAIDRCNARLRPLSSFVLPGGSPGSAWLHHARTVCRRAERRLVTVAHRESLNPQAIVYLNRLSDLLFVLARQANDDGRTDVLWIPGRSLADA